MAKVNLDALIPREDFEIEENPNPGKKKETLSIEDIKPDSFFFSNVRKPDFQRETNEWENSKIVDFIESFINGDLIPAVILWRSNSGYLFVIDGSHRLSSLSAWINNDYGDGKISKLFYDGVISDDQIKIAEDTRKIVNKKIGSYDDLKLALTHPNKFDKELVKRAKNLAALAIQLQWIEGDASKAENSFFKINQQAAPIDKTELLLLESRKKPNCIAARAIVRGGKGHKYWSYFAETIQQEIQELAKEIHEILFSPSLQTPIKTLDIPIGGKSYSAQTLPLILEFVNAVNNVPAGFKHKIKDDYTGEQTIVYLKAVRKMAWRINSLHPSSLGLHPVVYFYSREGRFKIASFYAIVAFILYLEKYKKLDDYISIRQDFEKIIIDYDYLVQQINRRYRSANNSYQHIKDFYVEILRGLKDNQNPNILIAGIIKKEKFKYLTLQSNQQRWTESEDFTREKKSAVFITEVLLTAPKCKICNGYIHRNSITIDHIKRKADGGLGAVDNGQITHPYCNSTFKN